MGIQVLKGLRVEIDKNSKNPFKILWNKILIKSSPYLGIKNISRKHQFKYLRLWMLLKKKITGPDGFIFIENL